MQNYMLDMGFEQFNAQEDLLYTLAYSIACGLSKAGNAQLLCDFSAGTSHTGNEILSLSLALAKRIKQIAEKRIGIVIPPSHFGLVCNYACIFAGKIPVNLNFTLGKAAADSCIKTAGIKTMVCTQPVREKISKANPNFSWSDNFIDIAELTNSIPTAELDEIISDIQKGSDFLAKKYGFLKFSKDVKTEATLVFTSGSEGSPKAAILTERNIIGNCLQTKISRVFDADDILLANLPIFHSFGMLFEVWFLALQGQKTVTLISPLDIKNNIRAMREKRATCIIGSPTFFRAYLKYASADDMKSLRKAIAGAEKTPKGFHEMWNESFGDTYREGYGLTEATPVVGVNLPDRDFGFFSTGSRKGSIGKLFPGMQAKILDPTTLAPLPFGEQGLLAMRGANIFAGYLDNPKATAEALHGEWLITGDLSRIDKDGFLYIDGRLSRFSKIGGEMVPHATVETALNNELGFAASDTPLIAVSSRLDEGKGEALVLLSATDITLADVKNALRKAGISNLWHPKYLVRVDKIPLLPSGKLDLKTIGELAKRPQ